MNRITFKGIELTEVTKYTQTYADTLRNAGVEFEIRNFDIGSFYTMSVTRAGWEEIIYKSPKTGEMVYAYSFTIVNLDDVQNTTFIANEKLTPEYISDLEREYFCEKE